MSPVRWTEDEDCTLRREALAGSTVIEIASLTGRSESAVGARAHALEILLRYAGVRRPSSVW